MSTNPTMTITVDLDALADAVAAKIVAMNGTGPVDTGTKPKATPPKPSKTPVADDTDDDDADDPQAERRAELTAMRITSLRKIARESGFDPDDVAGADKETLVDSILEDEANAEPDDEPDDDEAIEDEEEPDEEPEDEDDDEEEDDDDEEEEFSREELESMSLSELKALGKDAGFTAAEMKGLDQDALIDLFMGDEDEEDEEEEYTEDDLKAMSIGDLLSLAKDWGVKIKVADKKNKKKVIAALMA